MPKSQIEEVINWLLSKSIEAEDDMLRAEGGTDYDYQWGRYEAYSHALDKVRTMLNG